MFDSTNLNIFNINDPVKNRASSSDKEKSKGEVCGTIFGKITLSKESINTKKVTNGPNFIIQSEAPASEVIVVNKHLTDLFVHS